MSRQALDEQVIETALLDLVDSPDEDSATLRQEQGRGKVLFTTRSRYWVGTLNQELDSAASEKWKSLSAPDRNAAKEAGVDLIDRVKSGQGFAAFRPRDRRILLWEDDPASTQPADPLSRALKPRPICAAPPGYADQRRIAVVVFSFAWSMHGGDATYVLRFDGTKWNVISRHLAYYA